MQEENTNYNASNESANEAAANTENGAATEEAKLNTIPFDGAKEKKWCSRVGIGLIVFTVITFVVQTIAMFAMSAIGEAATDYRILILMLPIYVFAVPATFFAMSKLAKVEKPVKQDMPVKSIIGLFLVAYLAMYIGNIVAMVINGLITSATGVAQTNVVMALVSGKAAWQVLIVVVIIGPICEEIVFRKLIIDRLSKYGDVVAIVTSAVAFGLFHGNIAQFIYATLVGLVIGYVYCRTKNLVITSIMHMIINFNGSLLGMWVLEKSNYYEFVEFVQNNSANPQAVTQYIMDNLGTIGIYYAYVFVIFGLLIAGLVIFCVNISKIKLNKGEVQIPKGMKLKTVLCNAGSIIFVILWIGMIVLSFISPYITAAMQG